MIVAQPDSGRRVDIPGAPGPVRKPVDINESMTGFCKLRTLRVYCFDRNSEIEGHAEGDEVYLVVLSGSVEVKIRVSEDADEALAAKLSAPSNAGAGDTAAYLPPGAVYNLFSESEADVAYVRAASKSPRAPRTFASRPLADGPNLAVILESGEYAESLRFRVASIKAEANQASTAPFTAAETAREKLLHVIGSSPTSRFVASVITEAGPIKLASGDTVIAKPGENPELMLGQSSVCVLLMLMA